MRLTAAWLVAAEAWPMKTQPADRVTSTVAGHADLDSMALAMPRPDGGPDGETPSGTRKWTT